MNGELLAGLCSPNNDIRRAAEATYSTQCQTAPEQVAQQLLGAIAAEGLAAHLRNLAAVLMRRLVSGRNSCWDAMSPAAQEAIRGALLAAVHGGTDDRLRKKVSDATSELATELLMTDPEGGWPGLLQALLQLVNHAGASQREAALNILAPVSECVAEQLAPGMGTLLSVLEARLQDTAEVRLAAMRVFCSLIASTDESGYGAFQEKLLSPLLVAVSDTVAMAPAAEKPTKEMLEIHGELVGFAPRFFRPAIAEYCRFMVSLAGAAGAAQGHRHLALEWVVTLVETKPTLARKVTVAMPPAGAGAGAGAVATPLPRCAMDVCFQMMLDVPEEPGWEVAEDEQGDAEDLRNDHVGAHELDRLAMAFGAKTALPVAFGIVNEFLQREAADDAAAGLGAGWRHAHAALHAMCQVVEVAKDTPEAGQIQSQVVACSLRYATHPLPRVRYMALQTLGQLLLDHGPDVQNGHHAQLVPVLLASMDAANNPSPRVRSHACAATVNFVDFCEPELLGEYLDQVLAASLGVMQVGPRICQEQAVAIVSSASIIMEDSLGEAQYNMLMPLFKTALGEVPATDDYRMLKGRLLECISLLGASVPRDRFKVDVLPVMQAMAAASSGAGLESDDPTKAFILKAWVRIGKALGPDFVPYLEVVMPPLLAALETPAETPISDEAAEAAAEDEDDEDSDTEAIFHNAKGELVQVRTSALEEQATSAQNVFLLAEALGPHFAPYVERCARCLAPLAVHSVMDDVRSYSLAALPELVSSVARTLALQATGAAESAEARFRPLADILGYFGEQLLQALQNESEMELLMTALQSLKACVENACRVDWSAGAAPETSGQAASALATFRAQQRRTPLVPATSQPLLADAQMDAISACLLQILAASIQRRAVARAEAVTDEDYDEEQREVDMARGAEEEELQFNISECLGAILKTHGPRFLPMLGRDWLPRLRDMSHEACVVGDRKLAAYIFCDVLEYCGESVAPVLADVLPPLLLGVASDEPTLRQPCAYGVGVAAGACPAALSAIAGGAGGGGVVEEALRQLCAAAMKAGAREGHQESATDNVVAAIGTMCVHLPGHPAVAAQLDVLWQQYLAYLPLRGDVEESRKATMQLAQLAARLDPGLLGQRRERLTRVWELVVGEAFPAEGAAGSPTRGPKAGAAGSGGGGGGGGGAAGARWQQGTAVLAAAAGEMARALASSLPEDEIRALWQATPPSAAGGLQRAIAAAGAGSPQR